MFGKIKLGLRSWYSWPSTPPCHGGDRRFESGRARQNYFENHSVLRGDFCLVFCSGCGIILVVPM